MAQPYKKATGQRSAAFTADYVKGQRADVDPDQSEPAVTRAVHTLAPEYGSLRCADAQGARAGRLAVPAASAAHADPATPRAARAFEDESPAAVDLLDRAPSVRPLLLADGVDDDIAIWIRDAVEGYPPFRYFVAQLWWRRPTALWSYV